MLPRVAVVMSVYKEDNVVFFKKSVESILNQCYERLDLFIWVDGPVTKDIDSYLFSIQCENRVIIKRAKQNHGLAFSLNSIIDHVQQLGNYTFIARMDSDDISLPERISMQVGFLQDNPDIDVVGTGCREFGGSFALEAKILPACHEELLDFSIVRCPFIHPTVMFRASIFDDDNIRYPTNTELTEDLALWYKLLCNGTRFANVPDVLLNYRLNDSTLNRRKGIGKALSEVKVRFKYMRILKRISVKNILGVLSRLVFHVMPLSMIRLAYKYLR